jgi:hypothetical protein
MTPPRRHPRRQARAFAAITAIVLMGLVATTLAGTVMILAADARRTRAAAAEAQLRQLLLAGAAAAQQRLAKDDTTFDAKLNAPADGVVQLTAAPDGDNAVRVTVAATMDRRHLTQTIRFTRDGERWKLETAELRP